MKQKLTPAKLALISMVFGLLLVSALFAGCTQSTPSTPATTVATTAPVTPAPTPVVTGQPQSRRQLHRPRHRPGLHSDAGKPCRFHGCIFIRCIKDDRPLIYHSLPGNNR